MKRLIPILIALFVLLPAAPAAAEFESPGDYAASPQFVQSGGGGRITCGGQPGDHRQPPFPDRVNGTWYLSSDFEITCLAGSGWWITNMNAKAQFGASYGNGEYDRYSNEVSERGRSNAGPLSFSPHRNRCPYPNGDWNWYRQKVVVSATARSFSSGPISATFTYYTRSNQRWPCGHNEPG